MAKRNYLSHILKDITTSTYKQNRARLRNSRTTMFCGSIFVFGSVCLLVWNEDNSISMHRTLASGLKATTSLSSAEMVDSKYEGRLVHVTGLARTSDEIGDSLFGVKPSTRPLLLKRSVEMLQWVENTSPRSEKHSRDSATAPSTYTYRKKWERKLQHSNEFSEQESHENPGFLCVPESVFVADPITLEAFTLEKDIAERITWWSEYKEILSVEHIPDPSMRKRSHPYGGRFYIGDNPSSPAIGDCRVTFQVAEPENISVVAMQSTGSLIPFRTDTGNDILLVEPGSHSLQEMYKHAQQGVTAFTCIVRVVGFFLIFLGLNILAAPITVIADIIPLLGALVRLLTTILMLPVALGITSAVVALSWLALRTTFTSGCLVAAATFLYFKLRRYN